MGADLQRSQGGGGICGEIRVAGARAEDDDPPFFEVADRAAANIGLGDFSHRDRALHARVQSNTFHRGLQRQGIHHRGQHADVVGRGTVHPAIGGWHAAPDVAAANDHAHLHAVLDNRGDLAGNGLQGAGVDAIRRRPLERFATQLEEDPPVAQRAINGGGIRHLSLRTELLAAQLKTCEAANDDVLAHPGDRLV